VKKVVCRICHRKDLRRGGRGLKGGRGGLLDSYGKAIGIV